MGGVGGVWCVVCGACGVGCGVCEFPIPGTVRHYWMVDINTSYTYIHSYTHIHTHTYIVYIYKLYH